MSIQYKYASPVVRCFCLFACFDWRRELAVVCFICVRRGVARRKTVELIQAVSPYSIRQDVRWYDSLGTVHLANCIFVENITGSSGKQFRWVQLLFPYRGLGFMWDKYSLVRVMRFAARHLGDRANGTAVTLVLERRSYRSTWSDDAPHYPRTKQVANWTLCRRAGPWRLSESREVRIAPTFATWYSESRKVERRRIVHRTRFVNDVMRTKR